MEDMPRLLKRFQQRLKIGTGCCGFVRAREFLVLVQTDPNQAEQNHTALYKYKAVYSTV